MIDRLLRYQGGVGSGRKDYGAMQLGDLSKWGIPSRIIDLWRARQGEALLPVQVRAIRKGLLGDDNKNGECEPVKMLISAPTSSGKSFCAEIAMVQALTSRKKTVLLFPLKSLAEQTYRLYEETYGPLGVKCLIATGDHPENNRRFKEGDYQVAITIYEKFNLLLTESLDRLKTIGLIVVDEIQTVAEPGRGAMLELLLSKVLGSVYTPSLVGLSAVIGDCEDSAGLLADWLGATLIEETTRPVDLVRGVAAEGSFRFRSYNDGIDGCEEFARTEAGDDPFDSFVRQIKSDSGPTLVFLKSRRDTVEQAFKLAASVDWGEARQALDKLGGEEPSYLIRSLKQVLSRGVAFHSSDLSPKQRVIVEQAFIDGEVRVVFSTTTLAMGINLPAETVYLETVKYSSGEYGGRPSLVPVSRSEFDNMTGRAGRLGQYKSNKPARAIILAETEFDREILWGNYVAADKAEPVKSAFRSIPLVDWLLNLIVAGAGDFSPFLDSTLFAATGGRLKNPEIENALTELLEHEFIAEESAAGLYQATSIGATVARCGLSVSQAGHYRQKMERGYPGSKLGWLALALSGPDWSLPPGILSRYEQRQNLPLKCYFNERDGSVSDVRHLIGDYPPGEPLPHRTAASLKALLLLDQWCRLEPVQKLEERYQIHLGQIIYLGDTAGHLVGSLAALVMVQGADSSLVKNLQGQVFSLRTGLPESCEDLSRNFGDILNRSDFGKLAQANIETTGELLNLSSEGLADIVGGGCKFKTVKDKCETFKVEVPMQLQSTTINPRLDISAAVACAAPEQIEIDGSLEGERYLVKINGFPVRLTGKSFKYFTKLAWYRLNGDSGWIYKEDIEIGFNQARYLYRMKNEIGAGMNTTWPVVENNRLGYYRLNVDPSKIQINLDNLKNHPDHELRQMVTGLNQGPVN